MQARRRFHEQDESVALIVSESNDDALDSDAQKIHPRPSATLGKWNIGGFLQNQLMPAVYSPLQHIHQFHQQTLAPQFQPSSPARQFLFAEPELPPSSVGFNPLGNSVESESVEEPEPIEFEVMAARDRTVEFSNAIRTLQSRNISRAVNIKDAKKATQLQNYSEFMMIAKHVGKNIASTYSKLEKLTMCKLVSNLNNNSHSTFICLFF